MVLGDLALPGPNGATFLDAFALAVDALAWGLVFGGFVSIIQAARRYF